MTTARKKLPPVTTATTYHPDPRPGLHEEVTAVAAIVDPKGQEEVAGPVPAEIVSDRRDTLMRRMPIYLMALVLMYFLVSDRIQGAQNADSVDKLTKAQAQLLHTVKRDEGYVLLASSYIGAQQKALKEANARLKAAGLKPVQLPPPPKAPPVSQQGHNAVNGGGAQPQPTPSPSGHSHPSPHPSHSPKPRPSPSNSPTATVCVDLPVLGHHCVPPPLLHLGSFYVIFR